MQAHFSIEPFNATIISRLYLRFEQNAVYVFNVRKNSLVRVLLFTIIYLFIYLEKIHAVLQRLRYDV
jgi:hypothetical protein